MQGHTELETHKYVLLDKVHSRLARLWLIGAGSVLLILILQSLLGKYQDKAQEVWSWALPTIMPTLSLIITVLGANALRSRTDKVFEVRREFYRVAYSLSAAYLLLIFLTIVIEPFTKFEPLELLKLSNLWLGPFQGLVASAIGAVFFTEKAKE